MDENQAEILLVEDQEADAELTLRALKKHHLANKVVWVRDGAEAIDYIYRTGAYANRADNRPRLILLDLKLPKIDGTEVLKRLKSDELTKTIPVVIMTSSAEERDVVETYKLGVNSYLVKPVDFTEFVEVVSRAGLYWAVLNKTPT